MIPLTSILWEQESDDPEFYNLNEIYHPKEQQSKDIPGECKPLKDGDEEDD